MPLLRCVIRNGSELAFYLDTSALAKLVVADPGTDALIAWLAEAPRNPVACDLVRTELIRTVRRVAPDRMVRARAVVDGVTLTRVRTEVFESAGRLEPADLRSLDALHLASALDLGDDLEGLVTYDARLAAAAELNGIEVVAPL